MLKTLAWSACLTRVADSAVLNVARSPIGMCSRARMASRFSVIDTGSPAARSSWTKPDSRSSIRPGAGTSTSRTSAISRPAPIGTLRPGMASALGSRLRLGDLQFLVGPLDVALVLEEQVERAADHVGGDLFDAEV